MPSSIVALIGAVVAVLGTLGGVIIGQTMTRDAQRKQWLRDNIRQECQELLGQLSVSFFALIDWTRSLRYLSTGDNDNDQTAASSRNYDASVLDLHRNLGSRLLIANEIKNVQISQRWSEAVKNYLFDYDDIKLNSAYESMVDDIVKIGLKT